MRLTNRKCLILNADYSPISIIDWQKSVMWLFKYEHSSTYGIEIVDFYKDDHIVTVNKNLPIPAVARTKRFFKLNSATVTFSRKNIFLRDNYTCQYCGLSCDTKDLTYDHVIPKSMWNHNSSPTCWTNIVTACVKCNRQKGSRTPKQAGMNLQNLPIKPVKTFRYLPVVEYISNIKDRLPSEWKLYLPESYLSNA